MELISMWEHYKKTFLRMQIVIALIVIGALLVTRSWSFVAGLLVVTEFFSVYGALWGGRVKRFARSRGAVG
jgi:hypothetical protein